MMGHPVFGDLLEEFNQHRLPSFLQVLNHVRYLKSQGSLRLTSLELKSIYNQVANSVTEIWKSAFIVPVVNSHALSGKMQREVEKKITDIRSTLSRFISNPDKLTAELSQLNKVYNITLCKCFINAVYRQDIISSNCNCTYPIVNLETYGNQLLGHNEFVIFEGEKAIFTQKVAEMEAKNSKFEAPTPPSSAEKADPGYSKGHLELKRARPISYNDYESSNVEMDASNSINWDPVLEAFAAGGVHPGTAFKILSLIVMVLRLSPDLLLSESTWRRHFQELFAKNR